MGQFTITSYSQHLASAGRRLDPLLLQTMRRGGLNVRDEWRAQARAKNPRHAPKYPPAIRMARAIVADGEVTVTVAPEPGGQGSFAAILERGTPTSRAQMSDVAAAEKEAPNFAKWLRKAAADNVR